MPVLSTQGSTNDIDAALGLEPPSKAAAMMRWIIAAVLAAIMLAAVLFLYGGGAATKVQYVSEQVSVGDLTVIVTATGSVQPTNQVDVSSELSGTIRKVFADYNSQIKAGQPLAELDTDKLRASLESSRAKLAAAHAKVTESEVTVRETARESQRKISLAKSKFTSEHDVDVARAAHERAIAALESARAEVGVAEADLKLNETNLSKATITSPINGVVLVRNVDPGQTVASSLQAPILFSIAEDLTQMEIQVDVDEADVGKVRENQTAIFSVDAYPDRKFPATIRELRFAPEVVQGVVTYKAVLTVDNSGLLLRPGMTATAEITVQEIHTALLVPNAALRFSPPAERAEDQRSFLRRLLPGMPQFRSASQHEETGDTRRVWMLRNGAPTSIDVTIGATDGKRTEIVEGDMTAGQAVIVDTATVKQ